VKTKLLPFFIFTTVLLGVFCAWQWKALQRQQALVAQVESARQAEIAAREEFHERTVQAEKERVRLEREVKEFNAVTANLRSSEAKQSSNVTALAERLRSNVGSGTGGTNESKGGIFGKDMGKMLGQMMKDPAMREMVRGQQKAMMGLMYSGLYKDLNLPKEQQEKLAELLLDGQMRNIEAAQGMMDPENAASDPASAKKAMADQKAESDEKIRALLGDEKFAVYEDYQKNVGERMQLNQLRGQLEEAKMPLQAEQEQQLLAILKDEKGRVPPVIPDDAQQNPADLKNLMTSDSLEKQLAWMEDYNKRVLERAGAVLTPEQFKRYKEFQDQQASMQKLGLKMAKEMFGAEGKPK
jgi:regulatory protein YycI of two-component signal transduction system YycFG